MYDLDNFFVGKIPKRNKLKLQGLIDSHTHAEGVDLYNLQHGKHHPVQLLKDLANKEKLAGIEYYCVFSMQSPLYFNSKTREKTNLERFPFETNNVGLYVAASNFGEKALPFYSIFPGVKIEKQIKLLDFFYDQDIVYGLKFHPLGTQQLVTNIIESGFCDYAQDRKLPIILHTGNEPFSSPVNALKVAKKFPDVTFSLAHSMNFEKEAWAKIKDFENVYVDICPHIGNCQVNIQERSSDKLNLPFNKPDLVLDYLYEQIPDKLLFGSDEPYTYDTPPSPSFYHYNSNLEDEVNLLLSKSYAKKIAGINVANYLNLPYKKC